MAMSLRAAMVEFLAGWRTDLDAVWRGAIGSADPDIDAIASDLELEVWEPIFPVRRGKQFPGMPPGAHCLRAFAGISPAQVRCVVLGQDPYPEPGFATGRAFEAGNVASWRELDKMFSKSIRVWMLQIMAARAGDLAHARSFDDWPRMLADIESRAIVLEPPARIADRWVGQGVLLLNASLTLTRFKVDIDRHQAEGHLRLWRPVIRETLTALAGRGQPLVFLGFGAAAAEALAESGITEATGGRQRCVLREHPAFADAVLSRPNPFILCNGYLEEMGVKPIAW